MSRGVESGGRGERRPRRRFCLWLPHDRSIDINGGTSRRPTEVNKYIYKGTIRKRCRANQLAFLFQSNINERPRSDRIAISLEKWLPSKHVIGKELQMGRKRKNNVD